MEKKVITWILIGALVVAGAIIYRPSAHTSQVVTGTPATQNVDGSQTIDITAYGGFSPRVVVAKAGIPTTLRVTTKETYDCSASLVIPKLGFRKLLGASGTEEIKLTPEQAQGTLNGLCGMGMYSFKVVFQS